MSRRIVAPLAALIMSLTACADATSSSPGSGIDHPTGAADPILVISTGGGFIAPQYQFTNGPSFALYGDGTLVVPGAQMEL